MVKALDYKENFAVVPFSHPLRAQLLGGLSEETLRSSMQFVTRDGVIHSAGDATIEMLRNLPPPMRFAGIACQLTPLRYLVNGGYDAIATRRHKLAGFVPDREPVLRLPRKERET